MGRWSAVFAALALSACAAVPAAISPASPSEPTANVAAPPPAATQYTTAARPDGVVGGARAGALANEVRDALRARGDAAEPDGALAAVAAWFAGQASGAQQRGMAQVALRAGFPGAVVRPADPPARDHILRVADPAARVRDHRRGDT